MPKGGPAGGWSARSAAIDSRMNASMSSARSRFAALAWRRGFSALTRTSSIPDGNEVARIEACVLRGVGDELLPVVARWRLFVRCRHKRPEGEREVARLLAGQLRRRPLDERREAPDRAVR